MTVALFLVLCGWVLGASSVSIRAPETIVNGRSLRVDLESLSAADDTRVTSIVACSSIDAPFHDYDPLAPESTGCNSPGFQSEIIFPSATSLFKVRQRSKSLFMRRRLVVRQSPVVYLQVHTSTLGKSGRLGGSSSGREEVVLTTQYRVPEKVLPLGNDETLKDSGEEGEKVVVASASVDSQEIAEVMQPGQLRWYEYSSFILGFVLFVACLGVIGMYLGTKKAKRLMKHVSGGGSYAEKRKESAKQVVSSWMGSAMDKGVYNVKVETEKRVPADRWFV